MCYRLKNGAGMGKESCVRKCKMRESKIKKLKMAVWLPLLVLLVGIAIVSPLVHVSYATNRERKKTVAQLNAQTYSERMRGELNKGVAVVNALEQILISENGEVNRFDTVAQNLITSYIQCVQLAPKGKVEQIYPLEGNEEGKIDLINDPERGALSRYARDTGKTVVQGPFELKQGGTGIAVRRPVYLPLGRANEPESFWGFTIAIIKVPEIFDDSVGALTKFGYDYKLVKTSSFDDSVTNVCCSGKTLDDPQICSFMLGCCEWTLEVAPAAGWNSGNKCALIGSVGLVISVLFAALVLSFLLLMERSHKYKNLAAVDALTGLLNRAGFEAEFRKYLREHPGEPCVQMVLDVDDFKIVNDLYGHGTGDYTLKHLANELLGAFGENSIIARNGGDEFGVILKGRTNRDVAAELKKFTQAKRAVWHGGQRRKYSVSMGYAEYPAQAKTDEELAIKSDIALYEAKLHGKHNCFAYNDSFRSERRTKLGFALHEVSENLPGAFLIYKADPNDDTMLYANDELVRLAGCEDLDDFMSFCGKRFSGLIRPDERERVEKSIWAQIEADGDGVNDYVQFHFATKGGEYKPVLDHGRIVYSENYGRVFYVLITDSDFIKKHYAE